ncbi:MAG: hydrogenase large subunit [Candidatus Asgardarchaeia archaeon]
MSKNHSFIVPIGPYHPALKEAEYFKLEVEGERIIDADIKVGYTHRGIEKIAMSRTYWRDIFLFERVCGICSGVHTNTFCQTVEELVGIEIPERAKYLRTIMLELERLHSHLLWFGVGLHIIGFDTLFMHVWRDREIVQDILEMLTGNRVNYGYNKFGGVRRDLSPALARGINEKLDSLEKALKVLLQELTSDPLIFARVKEIGLLHKNTAKKYCVVGPTARASSIAIDVRKDDPYDAYDKIEWSISVYDSCDVLARVLVRYDEMVESVKIIRQALKDLPEGPISVEIEEFPEGIAMSRCEAPRGELFYFIKSNGTNIPERVKVRTPSYMNIPSVKPMLIDETLADVPIILASVDPCFSCTDRVIVIDSRKNKEYVVTFEKLEQMFRRKRR